MSYIYQIIQYEPSPCSASFADTVSNARREGDEHPDKAIIADTMKSGVSNDTRVNVYIYSGKFRTNVFYGKRRVQPDGDSNSSCLI